MKLTQARHPPAPRASERAKIKELAVRACRCTGTPQHIMRRSSAAEGDKGSGRRVDPAEDVRGELKTTGNIAGR